ncbi:replication factor-a protein [Auricularia subglabra TFB-10046 SS5]|nr:replication factor-a protein [Auricularia subglabra TFB-10046 SS5]
MTIELTSGAIARMCDTTLPADDPVWKTEPILQVVQIKEIVSNKNGGSSNRRRGLVSDGRNYAPVMFTTQLNQQIEEGKLGRNAVVRVKSMTCNTMQEKRLIVLLEVEVLEALEYKIGEPKGVDKEGATTAAAGSEAGAESSAAAARAAPLPPAAQQPAPAKQVQQAPRAQQQAASAPAASRSGPPQPVYPIEGLSPYQNKWTIQARVTNKSEMKSWSNTKGEGKLFSCTFMDQSGEIRATAFNTAAEELFEKLKEGNVYYVTKARVSVAKKKFSNLPNEYEITMDRNTEIEEIVDDDIDVPLQKYEFVSLKTLDTLNKDEVCDVIGVVQEVGPVNKFLAKTTQRELTKRDLTIVDQSECSVRLTLWGKQAENWSRDDKPVVAFKGCKVGDFGGRTLSLLSSGSLAIDPDLEESHRLRGWFDAQGKDATFHSFSSGGGGVASGPIDRLEAMPLAAVREMEIVIDQPQLFVTRAAVVHVKADDKMWYAACQRCNKKISEASGKWRCEHCKQNWDEPSYRYMLSIAVADNTSQCWLTAFNDAGLTIVGQSGNDLHKIKGQDESGFNAIVKKAVGKYYTFSCRAKSETYQDLTRTKYTISRLQPLDWKQEIDDLEKIIQSY